MKKLFLILIVFTVSAPAWAVRVHGVLRVVKGQVKVKSARSKKTKRARIGQKVYPKDTIMTGKNSRAKIVMVDKNEILVSPESEVVLKQYEFDPKKDKKKVLLNVIYGKIRSKVNQKYDDKGKNSFRVKTPTAVAGVRGTDFFTSYDAPTQSTQVVTFKGQVAVGLPGRSGNISNPVIVNVGQSTSHKGSDKKASPPKALPKAELSRFDRNTDLKSAEVKEVDPRIEPQREPSKEDDAENNTGRDPANVDPGQPKGRHDVFEEDGDARGGGNFGECRHCPTAPPPQFGGHCPGGQCVQHPNKDFINETVQQGSTLLKVNVQ